MSELGPAAPGQMDGIYPQVLGADSEAGQKFARATQLISAREVDRAVDQMAVRITVALQDKNPVVVTVLQGGLVCAGMLMRRLIFPLQQGYVHVGRYGDATRGGKLEWLARACPPLQNRHVLLVDDILDQGHTLQALLDWAGAEGAASVQSCVLVNKVLEQTVPRPKVDFVGLSAPDKFLVGCGMDYLGYGRNLPGIYAIED